MLQYIGEISRFQMEFQMDQILDARALDFPLQHISGCYGTENVLRFGMSPIPAKIAVIPRDLR